MGGFAWSEWAPRHGWDRQGKAEGAVLICPVEWLTVWVSGILQDVWDALMDDGDEGKCHGEGWVPPGRGESYLPGRETPSSIVLSSAWFKVICCALFCCRLWPHAHCTANLTSKSLCKHKWLPQMVFWRKNTTKPTRVSSILCLGW